MAARLSFTGRRVLPLVCGNRNEDAWIHTRTAILDRAFRNGQTYEGIPAFSPADYRLRDKDESDAVVVICVGKKEYHDEILATLKDIGFRQTLCS